jgi:hypothetical protein
VTRHVGRRCSSALAHAAAGIVLAAAARPAHAQTSGRTPAAPAALPASPTLAQLQAAPGGARGDSVDWRVQLFALESADGLRKGLAADELYLLATGPGRENATLYVAVPPALEERARALVSVAPITVRLIATVREVRSDPLGVPILDAVALTRP